MGRDHRGLVRERRPEVAVRLAKLSEASERSQPTTAQLRERLQVSFASVDSSFDWTRLSNARKLSSQSPIVKETRVPDVAAVDISKER